MVSYVPTCGLFRHLPFCVFIVCLSLCSLLEFSSSSGCVSRLFSLSQFKFLVSFSVHIIPALKLSFEFSPAWEACILVPMLPCLLQRYMTVTVTDSFPLPCIEDSINSIGAAKYIAKLDLLKGYWQVPLTSGASEVSAFVTPDHFFCSILWWLSECAMH